MKHTIKSFGYALEGLVHAVKYERNLRRFLLGHALLIALGIAFKIDLFSLILATMTAGFFVVTELLNTAIERVTDTFDDYLKSARGGHEHPGVKMAKDVGSAASLVALTMYGIVVMLAVLPYVLFFFAQQ